MAKLNPIERPGGHIPEELRYSTPASYIWKTGLSGLRYPRVEEIIAGEIQARLGIKEATIQQYYRSLQTISGTSYVFEAKRETFHSSNTHSEQGFGEVAYAVALLRPLIENTGRLGKAFWVEVSLDGDPRHLLLIKRDQNKNAFLVMTAGSLLWEKMAENLGIKDVDYLRSKDWDCKSDGWRVIWEICNAENIDIDDICKRLIAVRIDIPDIENSYSEHPRRTDVFSLDKNKVRLNSALKIGDSGDFEIEVDQLARLFLRVARGSNSRKLIKGMFDENFIVNNVNPLWEELGLDSTEPGDIKKAKVFVRYTDKFLSFLSPTPSTMRHSERRVVLRVQREMSRIVQNNG